MKRVYKGDIPKKVKKAFAERLRYQRIKGRTNTEEYKRVMKLREQGEITYDIAVNAFRMRKKVSRKTLTEREKFEYRKQQWIDKGWDYSFEYQKALKQVKKVQNDNDYSSLLKEPTTEYDKKKIRLNSLLEKNLEFIYKGAESETVDYNVFKDIQDTNVDMFDANNIDEYIKVLENYENNKSELVKRYDNNLKEKK